MSGTTTPAELAIPRAAFDALFEIDAPMTEYVRAIAAPVVAAELRRLSDHYGATSKTAPENGEAHAYSEVADDLLARADELDGTAP